MSPNLYRVQPTYPDEYEFPTCWIRNIPDVDLHLKMVSGQPVYSELPQVIEYQVDRRLPLQDFAITSGSMVLVSRRLLSLIRINSSCGRAYDSTVYFESEVHTDSFKTIVFESRFDCMDDRASRFRDGLVDRLVVAEQLMPKGEGIFRLGESPVWLLATEQFKTAAEEEGVTGMLFTKVKVRK
jgi:hypothetical protein